MPGADPLSRQAAIELALDTFGGNRMELEILLACAVEPTAASDLSNDGRVKLSQLSYYFGQMRGDGLIRVKRTVKVRGALKSLHAITPKGRKVLAQLGIPEPEEDASS